MNAPRVVSDELSDADRQLLVALRRDLHRRPELSWAETATQARLERALHDVGVITASRVARTGLVAVIPGRDTAVRAVALRGDIDALPITENTGLPFASEMPGVMHACGHDVHAAWAVGAALLLARSPAAGEVRIVLQPAEETGEGAAAILESGALEGVGAIFGGHVDRRFEVGQIVAQSGAVGASTDTFHIVLHGNGAHGARPQEARDPIVGAAFLVTALQTIISRRLDPALAGVVSVGTVNAGRAANVIPDRADLSGTIRATTSGARALLCDEVQRLSHAVAAAHGLTAEIRLSEGTPPVVNDPRCAAWAAEAAHAVLGPDAVVPLGTTNMGGEDFAFYLERMPGCFLRVGAREPGGALMPAHSPQYYAAEDALFVGARVLAQCARVASEAISALAT